MTTSKTKTDKHTRRWLVWLEDGIEDDAVELWSSESWPSSYIVEEFIEEREWRLSDYAVASGGSVIVHIKGVTGGVESFEVYGEPIPVYRSRPICSSWGAP